MIKQLFFVFSASVSSIAIAQADTPPAIQSAINDGAIYEACVIDNAKRLGADNSEPAHDIVIAAERHCDFTPVRQKLFNIIASGYNMQSAENLLRIIPQEAEDNAVSALIELRAAKPKQ